MFLSIISIGDIEIDQGTNTISNSTSDGVTNFAITGEGYVDFNGSYGVKLPVGDNDDRPLSNLAVGLTRYNTQQSRLEVWDGSVWASVVGTSGGITFAEADDLSFTNALLFG